MKRSHSGSSNHRRCRRAILEHLERRDLLSADNPLFSPTLIVSIHGQTLCKAEDSTVARMRSIATDAAARVKNADRTADVVTKVVTWNTCGAIGSQAKTTAAEIKQIVNTGEKWDVLIFGYSRGGIYLHDLAKQIENDAELNANIDYLMTVMLDPTAARIFGDVFPTTKSSAVDFQVQYDDGHKMLSDRKTQVKGAAAIGCAISSASSPVSILGEPSGAAVSCALGALAGGTVASVAAGIGSAWGLNLSDAFVADTRPIADTAYRDVHQKIHAANKLGENHAFESHALVASWYNDSSDFGRDVSRFIGYKDSSVSVITITNNTPVDVNLRYRWDTSPAWSEQTVDADSTWVFFNRVYSLKASFQYDSLISSGVEIKTQKLVRARHYGDLDPDPEDGIGYLIHLDGDRRSIIADPMQADLIGVPARSFISKTEPRGDEEITLTAFIQNIGTIRSQQGIVRFYAEQIGSPNGSYLIGTVNLSRLNPAQASAVSWTGIVPREIPLGRYRVYAEIDAEPESSSSNNVHYLRDGFGAKGTLLLLDAAPTIDEPNNSLSTATYLADGALAEGLHNRARARGKFQGTIHQQGDVDWYRIEMLSWSGPGSSVWIESPADAANFKLQLFDAGQNLLAEGSVEDDLMRLVIAPIPRGSYYVRVSSSDSEANYDLRYDFRPRELPGDGREPDDVTANATAIPPAELGRGVAYAGSIERPSDVDWFRFDLTDWAAAGSHITFKTKPSQGDLGVWLHTLEGNVGITPIVTTDGLDRTWTLDVSYLPPGSYYIGVAANWTVGDESTYDQYYDVGYYQLDAQVQTLGTHRDKYEPNDQRSDATAAQSKFVYDLPSNWYRFGIPDRTQLPTLNTIDDVDWYRVSMPGHGQPADAIELVPGNATDVRLQLRDSAGQPLASGQRLPNGSLLISLDGRLPGEYYVQVDSPSGALTTYELFVTAIGIADDAFEPNNSASQATPLTTPFGFLNSLSIPTSTDQDWFQFTINSVGKTANTIQLEYERERPGVRGDGILKMELRDSGGRLIASEDDDEVSLQGLPADTYTLQVSGRAGATNTYGLRYDLLTEPRLPAIVTDDGYRATRLSFDKAADAVPLADGTILAWLSTPESGDDDLMYLDLAQPEPRPRVIDANDSISSFHLADGWVVWSGWDGGDFEVYAFDGAQTFQLTDNVADDLAPACPRARLSGKVPLVALSVTGRSIHGRTARRLR